MLTFQRHFLLHKCHRNPFPLQYRIPRPSQLLQISRISPPPHVIVHRDALLSPLIVAAPPATIATTTVAPAEEQPQRSPRHERSLAEKYHAPLCNFISFRDGIAYDRNHQFTREQLEPLTALDFYRWSKHQVYGDADADEGVSPPVAA